MKAVVDWLLARRFRLILLAAAMAPLFQFLSTALVTLETARRGPAQGAVTAAASLACILVLAFFTGGTAGLGLIGGMAAVCLALGVFLGAMLRSAGGLRLAFQGAILLCAVVMLLVTLAGIGPEQIFGPALERVFDTLKGNGATPEQLQAVKAALPLAFGWMAAMILAELLVALFLGCWWLGLALGVPHLGPEFRSLKLGWVLGVPAAILIALGLVLQTPVVQNLAPLALFGFLFQGLSVLHAWAYARQWHPMYVAAVYILLIAPPFGFGLWGLGGVGLVDNWFDLRSRLRK